MHLSAAAIHLLPPFLIALLIASTAALPRDAAQQRRLAEFYAQKPLHTTALLAGAAATQVAKPAMPTTALRSRVLNQHNDGDDGGELRDLPQEVLMDRERVREKMEEHIRYIELRELRV